MPDAAVYAIAAAITVAAVLAVALAIWHTGVASWREHRLRQRRGGYIDLTPTPGRPRLGYPTSRPRRDVRRPGS